MEPENRVEAGVAVAVVAYWVDDVVENAAIQGVDTLGCALH